MEEKRSLKKTLWNGSMRCDVVRYKYERTGSKKETNLYSRPTIKSPACTNNQPIAKRAPRKPTSRRRRGSMEMGEQMADNGVRV